MKDRKHISRIFGLLMSMIMLTAVFSKSIAGSIVLQEQVAASTSDDSDDSDKQTVVSELSYQVVIPSHAFVFDADIVLPPAPSSVVLVETSEVKSVFKGIFRHSYFEKLFEHHIAINAP